MKLENIEWDTSIQCRAQIDDERVHEYAMQMAHGDEFPPIEVYGTADECWIGDGWHRVLAVKLIGTGKIAATVHPGGRLDALRHALGANAVHGMRRTNADKRRCVEIALREFGRLSDPQVAKLCGVSAEMVRGMRPAQSPTVGDSKRPQSAENADSRRTGSDGKQYPATRPHPEPRPEPERKKREDDSDWVFPRSTRGAPPSNGMDFARIAIMRLEEITPDDVERTAAFAKVGIWLDRAQGRGPGAQAAAERFLTALPVPWETVRMLDAAALAGRVQPSAVLDNIVIAMEASAASLAQIDAIDIEGGGLEALRQHLAEIIRQVRRLRTTRTRPARRVTNNYSASPTTASG